MTDTTPPNIQPSPASNRTHPSLRFDWTDWLSYLDEQNAPDDQKRELIETLWSIVLTFVDLGWDIKSTPKNCGEGLDLKTLLNACVVSLESAEQDRQEANDDE